MSAAIPSNEAERLSALRRYRILDTPPEKTFDWITELAARIFSVPMSLITLVDENRQWVKSAFGLELSETPRANSICAHAIASSEPLIVPNATRDPRFENNPFVKEHPLIRFYAGAPLVTPEGLALGTLCILDSVPREEFSEEHKRALKGLAALVMDEIQLRLLTLPASRGEHSPTDIARARAEASGGLQWNQETLARVLDALPVGVLIADKEGQVLHRNPACNSVWGGAANAALEEYLRRPGWRPETGERLAPEDWALARAIRHGEITISEMVEIQDFDGKRKMVLNSAIPIRDASEGIAGAVAVIEDITEQRRAERALHRAEAELRGLIDACPLAIISFDRNMIVRTWSAAAERMFGWEAGEAIGRPYPLIPPGYEAEYERHSASTFRGEVVLDVETKRRRKDGTLVDVSVSWGPFSAHPGEVTGGIVALSDITAKKAAERALLESEARYRNLVEQSPNAMLLYAEGRCVYANPAAVRLFGAETAEVLMGHDPRELIHPGSRPEFQERTQAVLEGGESLPPVEARILRLDGTILWVEVAYIRQSHKGRPAVQALMRNITDRKRAEKRAQENEAALRYSEERFRRAVLDAPMPIMIHAEDGRIVQMNRAWLEYSGYAAEDFSTTEDWFRKAHSGDEARVRERFRSLFSLQSWETGHEYSIRAKSGQIRTWTYSSGPLGRMPDGARMVVTTAIDLTERRSLEQQLAQAQKMEAIGQLAGGVAHDFNNLLTVISGYSELLLQSLPTIDPAARQVREIAQAAERATALTRQLLAFSRKQLLQPSNVDINGVIRDSERMLQRLIGEDIEIRIVLATEEMRTLVDTGQLVQVIMNLAVNARDAMPGGGVLIIETAPAEFGSDYVQTHPTVPPGSYVHMAISDSGIGMDQATLSRIFEPFFTTKAPGAGTGLGLSTVYGIIKQSNGHVNVYSEPGVGTSFHIYLPRIFEHPETRDAERLGAPATGNETILLVEDEPSLRRLAGEILKHTGYKVLEAANGGEALLICEQSPAAIALMLTDLVMPGMSGRELAERLRSLRPKMKVLYMSGYSSHAALATGVLEANIAFIQKPFTPRSLAEKVRQVLDSA